MSTRTRRKDRDEKKTKTLRRDERWQAKLAAAQGAAARYAVRSDWLRASVQLMVHRHTRTNRAGVKVTDPRALTQADQLLEYAGGLLAQIAVAVNGGDYDQPAE